MVHNLGMDYNLEHRQTAFELIKTLPTNSFRFFREIDEFITEEKRLLNTSGHARSAVYAQPMVNAIKRSMSNCTPSNDKSFTHHEFAQDPC
jgi:hypothetical protein